MVVVDAGPCDCCQPGSSGSSGSSGGGVIKPPVTNPCCVGTISQQLFLTITGNGSCACLSGTFQLDWDGTNWVSGTLAVTCGGNTLTKWTFGCNAGSWRLASSGCSEIHSIAGGGACPSPFLVVLPLGPGSFCCAAVDGWSAVVSA